MKNIYVLPTDKLSRLFIDTIENKLYYQPILHNKTVNVLTQNIYITSDEKLSLDGYHFNSKYGDEPQKTNQRDIDSRKYWEEEDYFISKIILTTDEDLIKDGVQAIDDEFLQWFVKNPSCEYVKAIRTPKIGLQSFNPLDKKNDLSKGIHKALIKDADEKIYKIITPSEEPKCLYETPKSCENSECRVLNKCNGDRVYTKKETLTRNYSNRNCQTCNLGQEGSCELNLESKCASFANDATLKDYWISCLEDESDSILYKQETLEEFAKNHLVNNTKGFAFGYGSKFWYFAIDLIKTGAKWQAERSYSEEELINAFNEGQALNVRGKLIQGKEWFEQFKKK